MRLIPGMTNAEREAQAATLLVAQAKGGDVRAFEALVRRYRKRIYALALHMTGSSSEADDIAQDVFLKAFRALPQFEGRSQFFRSEEHTSELQSPYVISYAVFCL